MLEDKIRVLIEEKMKGQLQSVADTEDLILFLIKTDFIAYYDNGVADPFCRDQLIKYLSLKGMWKSNASYLEKHGETAKESVSKEDLLTRPEFSYPYQKGYYHFDEKGQNHLHLVDPITLDKKAYIDRDFFNYFFAFRLSKRELNRIDDFLAFTVQFHFDGNINAFYYFIIYEIIPVPEFSELIGKDRMRILKLLGDKSNKIETEDKPTHREQILRELFRKQAGIGKLMTPKEMKDISSKRYNAFMSLNNPKHKDFREPTLKELENVKRLLKDSPEALALANTEYQKALDNHNKMK